MKIRYFFIRLEAHFDSSRATTYVVVLKVKLEFLKKKVRSSIVSSNIIGRISHSHAIFKRRQQKQRISAFEGLCKRIGDVHVRITSLVHSSLLTCLLV
jgi:hypothetical protein